MFFTNKKHKRIYVIARTALVIAFLLYLGAANDIAGWVQYFKTTLSAIQSQQQTTEDKQ